MNRFECIGRLVNDPELNTTNSGINVSKFRVAVNRRFKDENGEYIADFFNVVAWRGLGDNIHKYCKKGSKVYLAGELQNRSWDKEDGTKAYITELIANDCEFLDNKNNNQTTESNAVDINKVELTKEEEDGLPF